MTSIGQRGKSTEKEVEKLLTAWNNQVLEFAWHRMPDSRSARSFLKAQPADYLIAAFGNGYFMEVIATEHEYRLPREKISQTQTLNKFRTAGIDYAVIVHHTTLGKWRCIPGSFFEGDIPPSWDLRQFPLLANAREALIATGWFPAR